MCVCDTEQAWSSLLVTHYKMVDMIMACVCHICKMADMMPGVCDMNKMWMWWHVRDIGMMAATMACLWHLHDSRHVMLVKPTGLQLRWHVSVKPTRWLTSRHVCAIWKIACVWDTYQMANSICDIYRVMDVTICYAQGVHWLLKRK